MRSRSPSFRYCGMTTVSGFPKAVTSAISTCTHTNRASKPSLPSPHNEEVLKTHRLPIRTTKITSRNANIFTHRAFNTSISDPDTCSISIRYTASMVWELAKRLIRFEANKRYWQLLAKRDYVSLPTKMMHTKHTIRYPEVSVRFAISCAEGSCLFKKPAFILQLLGLWVLTSYVP